MGDAKSIFLRDEPLAQRWGGWTHGPDAERVFTFADAEMMNDSTVSMDMIRGARRYKEILMTLADIEEPPTAMPSSGIRHDLDHKHKTQQAQQKEKEKKK